MKVIKEVTNWKVDYTQPNHTYLMDGDKMIAYKVYHTDEIRLAHGHRMDKRYRKFEEVPYVASEWPLVDFQPKSSIITVEGSKGNSYEIDTDKETCSCPGFNFRGNCKHINNYLKERENA
jgi:hypothetical protein